MSGHTKGPYKTKVVEKERRLRSGKTRTTATLFIVAPSLVRVGGEMEIAQLVNHDGRIEANGRLLAAAPEMYDILLSLVQRMNTGESVYNGNLREDMNRILHQIDTEE